MIRVLVWNEFYHERNSEKAKAVYPQGIHKVIGSALEQDPEIQVRYATLEDENCGITKEILDETDVILWWGHLRHGQVPDEVAELVQEAVLSGMGAIFLHSGHHSKPFRRLMGTPCHLNWKMGGDHELLWVIDPSHPITQGIDRFIHLEEEETYGEPFTIPQPDEILFLANFSGGEVLRAGCLFKRGNGTVFYFQPGHETYPTYYNPQIQKVIANAVHHLAPRYRKPLEGPHVRNWNSPEGYVIQK